jgi:hypothetical protein
VSEIVGSSFVACKELKQVVARPRCLKIGKPRNPPHPANPSRTGARGATPKRVCPSSSQNLAINPPTTFSAAPFAVSRIGSNSSSEIAMSAIVIGPEGDARICDRECLGSRFGEGGETNAWRAEAVETLRCLMRSNAGCGVMIVFF